MKNLYIPDADEEKIRADAEMLRVCSLLRRHKNILELSAEGLTNAEIGKKLFKSGRTIELNLYEMMKATECKNKVALVATAIRLKIID